MVICQYETLLSRQFFIGISLYWTNQNKAFYSLMVTIPHVFLLVHIIKLELNAMEELLFTMCTNICIHCLNKLAILIYQEALVKPLEDYPFRNIGVANLHPEMISYPTS